MKDMMVVMGAVYAIGTVLLIVVWGVTVSEWPESRRDSIWLRHGLVFAPTWPMVAVVLLALAWRDYLRDLRGLDVPTKAPAFPPARVDLGGFAITREGDGYRKAAMDGRGARVLGDLASAGATHAAALLIHMAQRQNAWVWEPVPLEDVLLADDPFVEVWRRNASFRGLVREGYAAWMADGALVFTGKAYEALGHHLVVDESIPGKRRVS